MANKTPQEPVNRERRALFVFGYTAVFSAIAAAITLLGIQGAVAEAAVTGFIGLIWVMIVSYLTTSTVDRSEILSKLGAGFRAPPEVRHQAQSYETQTPNQARRTHLEDEDNVG